MTLEERIAAQLGAKEIQLLQYAGMLEDQAAKIERTYKLLSDCIRSGQLSETDIHSILEKDSEFKAWYQSIHPMADR
jgi:hypothetical protein